MSLVLLGANHVDCWMGRILNLKTRTPGQDGTDVGPRREQGGGDCPPDPKATPRSKVGLPFLVGEAARNTDVPHFLPIL